MRGTHWRRNLRALRSAWLNDRSSVAIGERPIVGVFDQPSAEIARAEAADLHRSSLGVTRPRNMDVAGLGVLVGSQVHGEHENTRSPRIIPG